MWSNSDATFFMINVYSSQRTTEKCTLCSRIKDFIHSHDGEYVLFGDFNIVRDASERFRSIFNSDEAKSFNTFIDDTNLMEIPLGGRRFTWMYKTASKMSRLDRVLVSQNVSSTCVDMRLTALSRGWSDHVPIMYHNLKTDFGPTPLRFFHSWLTLHGFDEVVKQSITEEEYVGCVEFHDKLKCIKSRIRTWVAEKKAVNSSRKGIVSSRLEVIDKKIDDNEATSDDMEEWNNVLMERMVTYDEIRSAVWDCGSDKAPGLDGFTVKHLWEDIKEDYRPISLVGVQYKIITTILANRLASVIDKIISKEQSTFISGRQILDGPMILSEEKVEAGLIRGSRVGLNNVNVSPLFYADDAVVISDWHKDRYMEIMNVFASFH
ncbi:uncharacterized protein [Rutidosis leptorrhynchoides]|uniref:uncharacterized protein n=1 Tax=Rutidosis leptorrhynchoides TaxID=125765 RepID=UPI003A99AE3E